jgi:rare lipoprotein A (peptidoglycan hydrolase)
MRNIQRNNILLTVLFCLCFALTLVYESESYSKDKPIFIKHVNIKTAFGNQHSLFDLTDIRHWPPTLSLYLKKNHPFRFRIKKRSHSTNASRNRSDALSTASINCIESHENGDFIAINGRMIMRKSRPYTVRGKSYVPSKSYNSYVKIGIASFYGQDCHNKKNALGYKFHSQKFTAASRDLPLPCVVIVENMHTGKRIKLLVNDRGPFLGHFNKLRHENRIIDLSEGAARALGFVNHGLARVRVICLPKESLKIARLHYLMLRKIFQENGYM